MTQSVFESHHHKVAHNLNQDYFAASSLLQMQPKHMLSDCVTCMFVVIRNRQRPRETYIKALSWELRVYMGQ